MTCRASYQGEYSRGMGNPSANDDQTTRFWGICMICIYISLSLSLTVVFTKPQVHSGTLRYTKLGKVPSTNVFSLYSHRKMAAEVGDSCSNLVFGQARNWTHLKTHAITNRRQLTIDYIAIYGCKLEELKMSSLKQVLGILRSNI